MLTSKQHKMLTHISKQLEECFCDLKDIQDKLPSNDIDKISLRLAYAHYELNNLHEGIKHNEKAVTIN